MEGLSWAQHKCSGWFLFHFSCHDVGGSVFAALRRAQGRVRTCCSASGMSTHVLQARFLSWCPPRTGSMMRSQMAERRMYKHIRNTYDEQDHVVHPQSVYLLYLLFPSNIQGRQRSHSTLCLCNVQRVSFAPNSLHPEPCFGLHVLTSVQVIAACPLLYTTKQTDHSAA